MDISRIDIEGYIQKEIKEDIKWLFKRIPIEGEVNYEYKILASSYNDSSKFISYTYILVLLISEGYIFILESDGLKVKQSNTDKDISYKLPPHFIKCKWRYPSRIDMEPVLEFMERYSYNNPVLLISESGFDSSSPLFESMARITRFEEVECWCKYLSDIYLTFAVIEDEPLAQLYELDTSSNKID